MARKFWESLYTEDKGWPAWLRGPVMAVIMLVCALVFTIWVIQKANKNLNLMVDNSHRIIANQAHLNEIMANQDEFRREYALMLQNEAEILANQQKILQRLRVTRPRAHR